jgi:hypothetical protein
MRRADLFNKDQFEGTTPQGEVDYWKQLMANAATPEERVTLEATAQKSPNMPSTSEGITL